MTRCDITVQNPANTVMCRDRKQVDKRGIIRNQVESRHNLLIITTPHPRASRSFTINDNLMPIVQFAPFSSLVQPAFWHELTNLKIDVLRLSDDILPITGSYSVGRSVKDRETGQEIALGCNLSVGSESFEKGSQ